MSLTAQRNSPPYNGAYMTEPTPPKYDRRNGDHNLAEILAAMTAHTVEYHADITPKRARELVQEHEYVLLGVRENGKNISRILEVVEGTPDVNALGVTIGYVGGMRNDIADLKHKANGGGGFSITARDKAQIVAWVTIVGTAVGAVFSQL